MTPPGALQIPPKKILVAIDFSPDSLSALRFVSPIVREFHSALHLVHVIPPAHPALNPPPPTNSEIDPALRQETEQALRKLMIMPASVPQRIWVLQAEIAKAVEGLVRSEHIDLIAVGSSGKSELKKFFIGSVADEILRAATCPVLAVGPHVQPEGFLKFSQLLYITSLWEESHEGLHYAISWTRRTQARLMILHVIEQNEPSEGAEEWLTKYRRMLRNLLPASPGDFSADPVLRVEVARHVVGRILQVADEIDADLIVMDVRPEEPWATHLRDKVYEIIAYANCPVLTCRTMRGNGNAGGGEQRVGEQDEQQRES
jgi:nucleotide-binding universal stress UspA family protein